MTVTKTIQNAWLVNGRHCDAQVIIEDTAVHIQVPGHPDVGVILNASSWGLLNYHASRQFFQDIRSLLISLSTYEQAVLCGPAYTTKIATARRLAKRGYLSVVTDKIRGSEANVSGIRPDTYCVGIELTDIGRTVRNALSGRPI